MRKSPKTDTAQSTQKPLTIGLLPYHLEANGYIERNRQALSDVGSVVPVPRPAQLLRDWVVHILTGKGLRLYDALILNWRENCLTRSNRITKAGVIEYLLSLLIHRVSSHRLIYVRHNRHPHNLHTADISKAKRWIRFGERVSDAVVMHSPEEMSHPKHFYVPHPLYQLPRHGTESVETTDCPSKATKEFLMFGRIESYKQIHRIIELWPPNNTPLRIMGPCNDKQYLNMLKRLADGKPINFEVGFHAEAYLAERVQQASGVIIANQEDSTLVSGSFFFALSCQAMIYSIHNPFMAWARDSGLEQQVTLMPTLEALVDYIAAKPPSQRNPVAGTAQTKVEELFGMDRIKHHWKMVVQPRASPLP